MKLIKILFAVIVILVLGNVTLTNSSVDESLRVAELTRDIKALEDQNLIRQNNIASLGSLTVLKPAIVAAGFVTNPTVVALPTPSSVALR